VRLTKEQREALEEAYANMSGLGCRESCAVIRAMLSEPEPQGEYKGECPVCGGGGWYEGGTPCIAQRCERCEGTGRNPDWKEPSHADAIRRLKAMVQSMNEPLFGADTGNQTFGIRMVVLPALKSMADELAGVIRLLEEGEK
jgi:hypothetical protein